MAVVAGVTDCRVRSTAYSAGTLSIKIAGTIGQAYIAQAASGGGSGGAVTQSGVWTIQPGNTANTTAWLVTGAGGTFPVTGTVSATQSGTWTVRNQDGAGAALASSTSAPAGSEQALIVRNIPSGTQTVSGTVTANAGTNLNTSALALDATLSRAQGSSTSGQTGPLVQGAVTTAAPSYTTTQTSPLSLTTAGGLRVDGSGATQPVSGTVTANAGSGTFLVGDGAGPLTVDGTVAATQSGTWSLAANQSVNVAQMNGVATSMGAGTTGTGVQRVVLPTDQSAIPVSQSGAWSLAANQSMNLAQVAGTATVNGGLAGSLAIGGTAANNAAITENPVLIAGEAIAQGSQPAAATAGNQRRILTTVEGAQFVQEGSSNRFSCFVQAVTVTTQCQAAPAAGLRAYVTGFFLSNQAATVQTLDIIFGTGANCVTSPVAMTHKFQLGTNATTTSPVVVQASLTTPLVPTAANAICLRPSAATAFGATITGFIAP